MLHPVTMSATPTCSLTWYTPLAFISGRVKTNFSPSSTKSPPSTSSSSIWLPLKVMVEPHSMIVLPSLKTLSITSEGLPASRNPPGQSTDREARASQGTTSISSLGKGALGLGSVESGTVRRRSLTPYRRDGRCLRCDTSWTRPIRSPLVPDLLRCEIEIEVSRFDGLCLADSSSSGTNFPCEELDATLRCYLGRC